MWAMQQYHKYDMSTQEEWLPFERDMYVGLTVDYLEREKLRQEQMNR